MEPWTRDQTNFIMEFLMNNEFIWNFRGEGYMNLPKRNRVLHECVKNIQIIRPNTTLSDLKKKIKSLKDQYNKEKIKVLKTKKSGTGTEDIYVPALWNYEQLDRMFSRTEARQERSHVSAFTKINKFLTIYKIK